MSATAKLTVHKSIAAAARARHLSQKNYCQGNLERVVAIAKHRNISPSYRDRLKNVAKSMRRVLATA